MAKKTTKKVTKKKTKKVTKKVSKKADVIESKVVRHTPRKKPKPDKAVAIVALILNIIIMPGLGTLIGGKTKEGIWQLALLFGGLVSGVLLIISVALLPLGVLLVIFGPLIAWIWAIVSGVQLIQESQ